MVLAYIPPPLPPWLANARRRNGLSLCKGLSGLLDLTSFTIPESYNDFRCCGSFQLRAFIWNSHRVAILTPKFV